MKRIALLGTLGLLALVGAAPAAAKRTDPPFPSLRPCVPHSLGYYLIGTLAKADVKAERQRPAYDFWTGTLWVDVDRTNHYATGEQTFTLSAARVKLHRISVDSTPPPPGSIVKLFGKITRLPTPCSTDNFTPTATVKKIDIRPAKD